MLPFYLKHVAFVGRFDGGTLPLKDLVYMAGGAPVDTIAHYTNYLVIGDGGRDTALYRKWERNIAEGWMIAMSPDGLRRVAAGIIPPPEPKRGPAEGVFVLEAEGSRDNEAELEIDIWKHKRDKFAARHGVLQPDGSRGRM